MNLSNIKTNKKKNCYGSVSNQETLPISSDTLLNTLSDWNINFKLFEHIPLNTVEESKIYYSSLGQTEVSIAHIKNLYLRDHKKHNYLLVVQQDKKIDLKQLSILIKAGRLSFGSPDRLLEFLGVRPGAVTPLAMINGIKKGVNLFLDIDLRSYLKIYAHPLVNDRTVEISIKDIEFFFNKIGVTANWIDLK